MPHSGRRKTLFRLQVQVEHWSVRILAFDVREVNPYVGLERTFVRREAGVAVYAKQRPSGRTRVCDKGRAYTGQVRSEAADEPQCRFKHDLLVSCLVLCKPIPIIVPLELT
jgi:hypothetical protein